MKINYRSDIDILRAIAVFSVVAFHWHIKPFNGGFVGVDIFFVISGFLITEIIVTEAESGEFSFIGFYERRIRRIFPALYMMVFIVFVFSWFLLIPSEYEALSKSILAVVTFSSNFLFWHQTGYFDVSSLDKPMLHTWSLAVEEQFYLIFPVLIWVIAKKSSFVSVSRIRLYLLIFLAVVSFFFSVWGVLCNPVATFYLPFSRVWEFLLGSILALNVIRLPNNKLVQIGSFSIGLCLLLGSIFLLTDKSLFPGPNALFPCIGTALIIWSQKLQVTKQNNSMRKIAIFFGKISYSLYLWHWPLFIYALFIFDYANDLPFLPKTSLFCFCVLISYLSYRYIEQPMRYKLTVSSFILFTNVFAITMVLGLISALVIIQDGFPSRFNYYIKNLSVYATYNVKNLYREETCLIKPGKTFQDYDKFTCFKLEKNKKNILLWGDSIAAHYYHALVEKFSNVNLMQASYEGCPPFLLKEGSYKTKCENFNKQILQLIMKDKPDLIILSANSRYYVSVYGSEQWFKVMHETLNQVVALGIPVVIFGPPVEYDEPLFKILSKWPTKRSGEFAAQKLIKKDIFELDKQMRTEFTSTSNSMVHYISILEAICLHGSCPVFVGKMTPMQFDAIHLTAEGSRYIVDRIFPSIPINISGK